ncbi:MAG: hypothetical protein HW410_1632 [Nitrosarchaeum sp.]|nr:hypothetical protein [Nitrosarchaeum sp.]
MMSRKKSPKLTLMTKYTFYSTNTRTGATVTGLTNGLSYDFKVSAVNTIGTGVASNVVSAIPYVICSVPSSGNWVITSSCKITSNVHPLGNVDVQNGTCSYNRK